MAKFKSICPACSREFDNSDVVYRIWCSVLCDWTGPWTVDCEHGYNPELCIKCKEETKMNPQDSAKAIIEAGCITIRVPVAFLDTIVEGCPTYTESGLEFKVTDKPTFAIALCDELNREEEDGTTLVHRMFDEAIEWAIEQGAEGVGEVVNL